MMISNTAVYYLNRKMLLLMKALIHNHLCLIVFSDLFVMLEIIVFLSGQICTALNEASGMS